MKDMSDFHNCAILNNKSSVRAGDKVVSITGDHDLTEGGVYEVKRVASITCIEIVNDEGIIDIYSVDWFDKI